jgi:hypothetical protein
VFGDFYGGGTMDFDPGPGAALRTNASGFDVFVLRLNAADGSFSWVATVAGAGSNNVHDGTVAGDGSAYVTGTFSGTASFGPGISLTDRGGGDAFVMKLNPIGAVAWVRQAGSSGFDFGRGIAVHREPGATEDSVFTTGYFRGSVDFGASGNPGDTGFVNLTSVGNPDGFVSRLTEAGNFVWTRQLGSTGSNAPTALVVDALGGVYTMGLFSGSCDFDPGVGTALLTTPTSSTYLSKLDADGNYVWARNVGAVTGSALALDAGGNAVVTGWFSGPFDTGAGVLTSNGDNDTFVLKVDNSPPPPPNPTKFYVVDDAATDRTFEYDDAGIATEIYALGSGNTAPRGAASTAAGDTVWVVDANKKVYIYDTAGALLGSWTAGSLANNATVEGIAVFGADVWLVDARQDKVFRYAGAASRLSGSQNAASSFALNSGNINPKDLVTDGTSIWVVNDATTDKVFKYTLSGTLLGSWTITGGGGGPTGITLDPSNGQQHLWVVDSATDRVYQYDNARSLTSGSLAASVTSALAAGNANPQGIADPPPPSAADPLPALAASDGLSGAAGQSSPAIGPDTSTRTAPDADAKHDPGTPTVGGLRGRSAIESGRSRPAAWVKADWLVAGNFDEFDYFPIAGANRRKARQF